MDNLTHAALGAAIGIVVMGRRTAPWKAALAGAIGSNLPDLDVFVSHGDAVSNVTMHRGNSHAVFWLTLASPAIALAAAALFRDLRQFRRWWLAIWLSLIAHPILDALTVYGTQIARPFSDEPFGTGSIFIIDPFYTLPLLACVAMALFLRDPAGRRFAIAGLMVSTLYLGWGLFAQHRVLQLAERSLTAQGVKAERFLVTTTAFNSILWRIVAVTPDRYLEGFHSLLDRDPDIHFDAYSRSLELAAALGPNAAAEKVARWSHGFYKLGERDCRIVVTDLRMGQEPRYSFNFVVAQRQSPTFAAVTPTRFGELHDLRAGLNWLWRRALGEKLPPPR